MVLGLGFFLDAVLLIVCWCVPRWVVCFCLVGSLFVHCGMRICA